MKKRNGIFITEVSDKITVNSNIVICILLISIILCVGYLSLDSQLADMKQAYSTLIRTSQDLDEKNQNLEESVILMRKELIEASGDRDAYENIIYNYKTANELLQKKIYEFQVKELNPLRSKVIEKEESQIETTLSAWKTAFTLAGKNPNDYVLIYNDKDGHFYYKEASDYVPGKTSFDEMTLLETIS